MLPFLKVTFIHALGKKTPNNKNPHTDPKNYKAKASCSYEVTQKKKEMV